ITSKCFITVSVGMVRVIICHQLNTKNNIISGSEVSRLSVAIQKAQMEEVISAHTCAYNQITAKLDQIAVIQAERKA
ncbi:hypothetical protein ABKT77_23835, partial [Enterobacter cloacae]|uniref:hypothetical protein n=1 Tax=Enterobacter cloacae TaxID=550 RepID=UPI0032AFF071